jgi:hypothetical protein
MEPKGPAAYITEFVGTFFLVAGAVAAALLYRLVMELDERPLPAQSPVRGESAEPPLAAAS